MEQATGIAAGRLNHLYREPSFSTECHLRDVHEYSLIIHPDMEVYSRVMAEKQYMEQNYSPKGVLPAPFITLADFMAKESMEETLIRWIQRVCRQQQAFTVTLNNYSGFPPHTIYLRVQEQLPFSLLIKKLLIVNEYIEGNGLPAIQWNHRPHVGVARHLTESVYEAAIHDFSKRSFCESFSAAEMVLIRRSRGADTCKIVNIFGFLPA